MALRLEIVSQQRQGLGEIGVKEFGQDGGTIGRSLSNDWALPDRNRFLSAKHAAIDFRSGSYYIVDTSTNGVYVNDSESPVGRGNPQRLFDGDRIRIGEYVMQAAIDTGEGTVDALMLKEHVDPVERAQRVEMPDTLGYDLLDEHVMTGVGIEIVLDESGAHTSVPSAAKPKAKPAGRAAVAEPASHTHTRSLLIEDTPQPLPALSRTAQAAAKKRAAAAAAAAQAPAASATTAAPAATATPAVAAAASAAPNTTPASAPPAAAMAAPAPVAAAPRPAAPRSAPAPTSDATPEHAGQDSPLSAFFRGAGLKQRSLSDHENNAALFLLGQLVRELLTGLSENLHLRAQQKTQLRLANTTIQKQDNNPLKFSAGTSEALENLLFRNTKEYMGPVEAVRDAYADICSHQLALLKALATAVPEYVNRLDPVVLEDKFARSARNSLVGAATKLKHWELYKELFQIVAHHAPGHLPPQFLEELARAYETENEREAVLRGRSKRQANVN